MLDSADSRHIEPYIVALPLRAACHHLSNQERCGSKLRERVARDVKWSASMGRSEEIGAPVDLQIVQGSQEQPVPDVDFDKTYESVNF